MWIAGRRGATALSTLDRHEAARARYVELFRRGGYPLDVIKQAAEGYARSSIWHARSAPILSSCALQVRY